MCLLKPATTFLGYLRPVLIFGKFFGSTLFSVKEPSRVPDLLYFVPVLLVLIKCLYDSFIGFMGIQGYKKSIILKTEDILTVSFALFSSFIQPAYYFVRRNTYKKLILEIDRINEEVWVKQKVIYPNSYKDIAIISSFLIALVLGPIALLGKQEFTYIEVSIGFGIILGINIIQGFAIRKVLREIHKQYMLINRKLQAIYLRTSEIVELIRAYLKITKIALDCNDLFNVNLLALLLNNFIVLVSTTHYIASSLVASEKKSANDILFMLFTAMGTSFSVLMIFLNIQQWTAVTSEAHKTATYIHDIWNTLANRNEIDNTTKHLQLISLQLYNSRLNFTAYGFFPLDWTLLHNIVGAVTTYVVILIQFEISSNTKNSA